MVRIPQSALRRGQRAAESLMIEQVTISRVGEWEENSEGYEQPSESVVWEGVGKVQTYEPYEQSKDSAGVERVSQRYQVHIPVSVEGIRIGDVITVKGYPNKFRVAGLHQKTYQTAQRLLCDVISSNESE